MAVSYESSSAQHGTTGQTLEVHRSFAAMLLVLAGCGSGLLALLARMLCSGCQQVPLASIAARARGERICAPHTSTGFTALTSLAAAHSTAASRLAAARKHIQACINVGPMAHGPTSLPCLAKAGWMAADWIYKPTHELASSSKERIARHAKLCSGMQMRNSRFAPAPLPLTSPRYKCLPGCTHERQDC
jgi:hypothetical protein